MTCNFINISSLAHRHSTELRLSIRARKAETDQRAARTQYHSIKGDNILFLFLFLRMKTNEQVI